MIPIWYHLNMKLINRNVDYSVRALAHVAALAPEVVPVSGMETKVGVPRPFLRKILQKLNKAGILRSSKGRGGGFVLARKPEQIYLKELINIFQGPIALNNCVFDKALCRNHKTCRLRSKIGALEEKMLAELGRITLRNLLK
ncbi:MAG TPA: Rrf2 family transcriptional regulator [Elusimicrobia bacterium]|nr:Rrf2 family transcriptional regulator [Elusimicrobiota bacterium]